MSHADSLDSDCRRAALHLIKMRGAEAAPCAERRAAELRDARYFDAALIWDRIAAEIRSIEAEHGAVRHIRR